MRRREFLEEFLGALGAKQILWIEESDRLVSGTVIYDFSDTDERQDFLWEVTETNVPCESALELARLLRSNDLLDSDKICINRTELKREYDLSRKSITEHSEFNDILESLLAVEVLMVDEGQKSDVYFIHE